MCTAEEKLKGPASAGSVSSPETCISSMSTAAPHRSASVPSDTSAAIHGAAASTAAPAATVPAKNARAFENMLMWLARS
jgi:hypothetical protein